MGQPDGYKPGSTVVLAGSVPGTGRSAALNYVVAWARSRPNWLTMYMPDAERVSHSGKRMVLSERDPSVYIQPDLHLELFSELLKVHAPILQQIKLKNVYPTAGTTLGAPAGLDTLYDLVGYGAETDSSTSGDVVFEVFDELAQTTECNVLVAVDRWNLWHHLSAYDDPNSKKGLMASRLALVKCFPGFV